MESIPVIVVVGATATGKTELAIEISKKFGAEIVSADSMQIYKNLDIGTAKPDKNQLHAVKHYMIDILEPYEDFSVKQYCDMAHESIKEITEKGKLPVIVGGTGLYVDSLVNNIRFSESETDLSLREKLKKRIYKEGTDKLLEELSAFDPEYAKSLEIERNPKRLIRAIEIYKTTGMTMTEHIRKSKFKSSKYNPLFLYLEYKERHTLYKKVEDRVDKMMQRGLLDEAKMVYNMDNVSHTAISAIGYKEFFPYFKNEIGLNECINSLKKASRRYAKRQITWFARNKNMKRLCKDDFNDFEQLCLKSFEYINFFLG